MYLRLFLDHLEAHEILLLQEGPLFRKNISKHRKKALSSIEILIKIKLEKALKLNSLEFFFLKK